MKKLEILGKKYSVKILNYSNSPLAMFIGLECGEGEDKDLMPITTCLGERYCEYSFVQLNTSFVNINSPDMSKVWEAVRLLGGEPYTKFGSQVYLGSGFVDYPLFMFSEDKLKEYDPEGYEAYRDKWIERIPDAQKEYWG